MLFFLTGALIGPWIFEPLVTDPIPDSLCPGSLTRLEAGHCATLLSGVWLFLWVIGGSINLLAAGGALSFAGIRKLLLLVPFYLLWLPLLIAPADNL